MATCTKCGAALAKDAVFCSSCGSPARAGVGTSQPGAAPGVSLPGIAPNVAGLLCYLLWPVAFIFFLLFGPYNKDRFVRFHAFQALFLGLVAIGVGFALSIMTSILALIPLVGWIVDSLAWLVYGLGLLGLAIFLMYKAYNGERYRAPIIGEWAAQRAEKTK
ncbi:MAG: zinc-ribbon domain-containing protein [Acidobacteriota bacterium]